LLYATLTFWLMAIVLMAWGVHQLLSGLLKPRTVNMIVLPGTLVAQLGHVLGLLVTGATVSNTTLYKDDDTAAPEATTDAKPRIPLLGPVIVGMLPLLACVGGIVAVVYFLGGWVIEGAAGLRVARALPASLPAFWESLRDQITLVESLTDALVYSDWRRWQVWTFVYLMICLTVRMAPFPGTLRGSLGAIVILGLGLALANLVLPSTEDGASRTWGVLSICVAFLSLLLLLSVTVRGLVGLFKLLAGKA